MQRTRAVGRENTVKFNILDCDILPELEDVRLDTLNLDELNFLAKRLVSLPNEELPVFCAVTEQLFNDENSGEPTVSIKDLINSLRIGYRSYSSQCQQLYRTRSVYIRKRIASRSRQFIRKCCSVSKYRTGWQSAAEKR